MRYLNFFYFISLLACIVLTGCAVQPQTIPPNIDPQLRTKILTQMQDWHAHGRAAIRDKDQGHNLSIKWQQHGQNYDLQFYGPLATGSVHIIGKPGHVSLSNSNGEHYEDSSVENIIFEHLGWDLPFNKLMYWIKGIPAPNSIPSSRQYDQYHQLRSLEQDGWKIDYLSYHIYEDITLPERINLSNHDLKLKLIISAWKR